MAALLEKINFKYSKNWKISLHIPVKMLRNYKVPNNKKTLNVFSY